MVAASVMPGMAVFEMWTSKVPPGAIVEATGNWSDALVAPELTERFHPETSTLVPEVFWSSTNEGLTPLTV
jgi:hypothetical protein